MSLVTPVQEQAIYKCPKPCFVLRTAPASATKLLLVCLLLENIALLVPRLPLFHNCSQISSENNIL